MIRTLLRSPAGDLNTDLAPHEALDGFRSSPGALLWVDLSDEAVASAEQVLRDVFQFHPLAVHDALRESHVPKIDDWTD